MPIMGDIKNLYSDKNQSRALFPTTKIKAVSDDDGKGLNAVLDDMTAYTRKVGAPHNLLDNSDFRNLVNQRGQTSYSGLGDRMVYTIDRWGFGWQSGATLTVGDGYIQKTAHYFMQRLAGIDLSKVYTAALRLLDGTTYVYSGTFANSFGSWSNTIWCGKDGTDIVFRIEPSITQPIEWAALYEGEYTAETLPEYQPKGYAAELAECRRYFRNLGTVQLMGFTIAGSKVIRIMGKEYSGMRIEEPTVGGTVTGVTSTTGEAAETIPTHTLTIPATEIRVNFVSAVSGIPTLRNCMVDFTGLTLSADL